MQRSSADVNSPLNESAELTLGPQVNSLLWGQDPQRFIAQSDPVLSILISVVDPDPDSQSRSGCRRTIMTLGQIKCFIPVYGTRNLINFLSALLLKASPVAWTSFWKRKKKFSCINFLKFLVIKTLYLDWIRIHLKCWIRIWIQWIRINNTDLNADPDPASNSSVVDPDPVGSESFYRIRIHFNQM